MTLRKALVSNSFASAGSIFWSALLQLGSVPILLKFWGAENYGVWLMLSTVPIYLALSDLGLGSVAASDMAMEFARGNITEVNRTFQSVLKLTISISIIILLIAGEFFLCNYFYFNIEFILNHYLILYLLVAYACFAMISRIILATYRAIGQYAFGTILYDALQFLEGISVLIVAMYGFSFFHASLSLLIGRIVLLIILCIVIKIKAPSIKIGFKLSRSSVIKRLMKPAFGAMAIPSSLAINMQGMVLVTGILLSPTAAAVLSPTRTMSRIAIQLVGIINRATISEFSFAFGRNDKKTLKKLIYINIMVMLLVLIPCGVLFAVWGDYAVDLWSHHKVFPEKDFVILMAVGMVLHGFWYYSSNLLLAINKHSSIATTLLLSSIMAVVLAYYLAPQYGMKGIAFAVLLAEFIALIKILFVLFSTRRYFKNN